VLEYGPGESTKTFQAHESVKCITSIEHSVAWAEKARPNLGPKVNLVVEINQYKYPYAGTAVPYDLVFVDGVERPTCIALAKFRTSGCGIVVVHDAERMDYKKAIDLWGFKFHADGGHTMFLTNEIKTADTLSQIL
jgi:hypothetical protein